MAQANLKLIIRKPQSTNLSGESLIDSSSIEHALKFHQSIPNYAPTPLVALKHLASCLGLQNLWIKDESKRFNLKAFKCLGGSYALAKYLAAHFHLNSATLNFQSIKQATSHHAPLTFVTATDGNHGRGIAWAARQLQQQAVVYMPQGSQPARVQAIADEGAQVKVLNCNYDEAVRYAAQVATAKNWILLQDTAYQDYTEIPTWIMQGYTTIAAETIKQLGGQTPTHLILQAGVGSFAAAIIAAFRNLCASLPLIILVEPHQANCLYRSAQINDGKPHQVTGHLNSIMAGLCCGEPNPLAWPLIRASTTAYASCSDPLAAYGMRILGSPLVEDKRIIAGESGAISTGLIAHLLLNPAYRDLCHTLQLTKGAQVLCINTEGDTDPASYRQIVWEGQFPLEI